MTFFATNGLRRTFGGVVAVDDASVELLEGRINGLIGPNGSGKTTFFNLVTGMIAPDAAEAGEGLAWYKPRVLASDLAMPGVVGCGGLGYLRALETEGGEQTRAS